MTHTAQPIASKKPRHSAYAAFRAIVEAQRYQDQGSMPGSAKLAADDALALFNQRDYDAALSRACVSLEYSLGVFAARARLFSEAA